MSTGAYSGTRWREARRAALARDNNRCQDCGATEDLHVHHVDPVKSFALERDAHFVENLVTLCKYCHPSWEGTAERPVLADERSGIHVADVAEMASRVTIKRLVETWGGADVFDHVAFHNPSVCSTCFEAIPREADCPGCGAVNGRAPDQTMSKIEMVQRARKLADLLERKGYSIDRSVLRQTVWEKKARDEYRSHDTELYRFAVRCALEAVQR